jgi:hypothetical protein
MWKTSAAGVRGITAIDWAGVSSAMFCGGSGYATRWWPGFGHAAEPLLLALVAMALVSKGVALYQLGRPDEAAATLDWEMTAAA